MREVGTVLGGVGLLIFGYLVFTQAPGFAIVAGSLGSLFTNSVSVLQGRQVQQQSSGGLLGLGL